MDHNKLWKILKEMGLPDHLTCFLKTCMQLKKQWLELEMEQQTGSKLGKEYVKAENCYFVYLTNMQSISCKMLGGWSTKWNKIARRNINNFRYSDDTTLMAKSEEELTSLLMKVKEKNKKAGLKLNIQKSKITASGPITSWQIDGETNHCRWWLQPRN